MAQPDPKKPKSPPQAPGLVSLVGAGPGDPGLITLAGVDRLRYADVVVYDALANPRLLDHAPPHARLIDAGKRARNHRLTQDQTNRLLCDLAHEGRRVVRLKGGDPYLFGRGAEEAVFLAEHGVRVEVIAGITAGIAGPMAAGIPVTHRKIASTVTFVTGHEDPSRPGTHVDYAALAALIHAGGTACFYMGVGRLPLIAEHLTSHGLPDDTPAAVVQWGTLPTQRTVRGTLADIAPRVEDAGITAPAIVVVGAVAGLDEPGLDFFTDPHARPLLGRRILITRTRCQSSRLREMLEALGAHVIEAPTIQLLPPASWDAVDVALRQLPTYRWLLLTSVNGVDALADRFDALGFDARRLAGVRLAVIGDATAAALRERLSVKPDLVPDRAVSASLADRLAADPSIEGARCLLLTADAAPSELPRRLRDAGAVVDVAAAYRNVPVEALPDDAADAIERGAVDWAVFTSSSTASNLVRLLGGTSDKLRSVAVASIGPRTSATCVELGLSIDAEPVAPSLEALVEALARAERRRR